jgi:2-octaprenyl-6-methoxyphenol hydroxylase
MTDKIECDIYISGGGLAGLLAAAAFGRAGFSVVLADPNPPLTDGASAQADLRTTALLQPARDLLAQIGLWDRLMPFATPLQVMRIVDAGGDANIPRGSYEFDAGDISDRPFGWNVQNWVLRREIMGHMATLGRVQIRTGVGTAYIITRMTKAHIRLSDGVIVRAKLVIGADGRASPVRDMAGIGTHTRRYGQKALAFAVAHPVPHHNTSTEIHRSGGPFTLVPLRDHDGTPASAVVWMDRGPEIQRRAILDEAAFNAEATERSAGLFGQLSLITPRSTWPIITQTADRMVGERIALMAEAAHVMPPIGAQGLNTSLADLRVLLDLARQNPDDPGAISVLAGYEKQRMAEIRLRVSGVDILNRASMANTPVLRDLRLRGLDALYTLKPMRKLAMKAGLGATR